MLGGMTPPIPPEPPIGRLPEPSRIPPDEPENDPPIRPRDPDACPIPIPLEPADIPSDIDDRLKEDRTPDGVIERGRKPRLLPPPIRVGMKPPDMPL